MNSNTKLCDQCNLEIGTSGFDKHYKSCNGIGRKKDKIKFAKELTKTNGYTCKKCEKKFDLRMEFASHNKYCSRPFEELGHGFRRKILLENSNYSCSACGYNKTRECGATILEIDHIDGNHTNNARENLRVLCPNCHALTPNFRNWGRSSKEKTSKRIRKGNKEFKQRYD